MIANNYIQCDGTVGHNDRHGVCILDKFCCKGFSVRNLCPDGGICCYGTPDCALDSSTNAIKQSYNPCPLIIPRQQWRARQPNQLIASIPPAEHVFVHHTDDGNTCQSLESCGVRLRSLQSYHQFNKDWPDIAWNFIIGGNGQVYEGVGWNRQGFHTLNWNHNSIGVAFVGNFNDEKPTESMLNTFHKLLECGVKNGFIRQDYHIHGHRDVRKTSCPGQHLYDYIKHLQHFKQLQ